MDIVGLNLRRGVTVLVAIFVEGFGEGDVVVEEL